MKPVASANNHQGHYVFIISLTLLHFFFSFFLFGRPFVLCMILYSLLYKLPVFEHSTVQFLGHVQVNIYTFVLAKCSSIYLYS